MHYYLWKLLKSKRWSGNKIHIKDLVPDEHLLEMCKMAPRNDNHARNGPFSTQPVKICRNIHIGELQICGLCNIGNEAHFPTKNVLQSHKMETQKMKVVFSDDEISNQTSCKQ